MKIMTLTAAAILTLISSHTLCADDVVNEPGVRRASGLPPEGYDDNQQIPGQKWKVHDIGRPEPGIITPGSASTEEQPGHAPSDAIVLFDGTDLSKWNGPGGKEPGWKIEGHYTEVTPGSGSITTKEAFGSCQLHLEFATPTKVEGKSQGRGNSGIIFMGLYEIQLLDSYNNRTYPDGQLGAIYGQYPPLVNVARPPGKWQTYDIIFEAPTFDGDKLLRPAYFTVLLNGVLLHHHMASVGRVRHKDPASYEAHDDKLPLLLQDHGNPTRFRNIWIRPLFGYDEGPNAPAAETAEANEEANEEAPSEDTPGEDATSTTETPAGKSE